MDSFIPQHKIQHWIFVNWENLSQMLLQPGIEKNAM